MKQNQRYSLKPNYRFQTFFTESGSCLQKVKEVKVVINKILARGIQQNNSSIIVEQHSNGCMQSQYFDENESINKMLIQYRVKYDKIKTQTLRLEIKINQYKEEKRILKEGYFKIRNDSLEWKKKYNQNENLFGTLAYETEQSTLKMNGYKFMQNRLRLDIIHYKRAIFELNLQLRRKQCLIQIYTNKSYQRKQLSLRCKNLLASVQKTLKFNHVQRSSRLNTVTGLVSSRYQHFIKNKQRQSLRYITLIEAQAQKLPEQKYNLNLFHTHKFVKKMLHYKMQNLMAKYQSVSNSYRQIQSKTNINNVQDFVYKYINKDIICNKLSQSVQVLKQNIQKQGKQHIILLKQNDNLQRNKQQIMEIFKQFENYQHLQQDIKQLFLLNQKIQNINKLRIIWIQWALTVISMLKSKPRKEISQKYSYFANLIGDCLRLVLRYIQNPEDIDQSICESTLKQYLHKNGLNFNDVLSRNKRVKTIGNECTQQQQDIEYDLAEQKNYIHSVRRAVKKRRMKLLFIKN